MRYAVLALWLSAVPISAAEAPKAATLCATRWQGLFQQRLAPTHIPEALERVLARHKGRGLFATFTEEKHVALLRRPLRSSGELIFLPNQGLHRKLQTPFHQELVITPEAIYQRDPRGNVEKLALDTLPAAQAFVTAFLSVFSGSWDALQTHFQLYFDTQAQGWRLGLAPTHHVMHTVIACIVLEGNDDQITAFAVQETNGDMTADQLHTTRLLAPDQWVDYQPYFAWALQTGK